MDPHVVRTTTRVHGSISTRVPWSNDPGEGPCGVIWRERRHEGTAEEGDSNGGNEEEAEEEEVERGRIEGRSSGNGTGCGG